MFRYKLVQNGSDKLVIVFQSAGRLSTEDLDKILENKISEEDVKERHKKYNWMKLSSNKYADFLYIEDYYSKAYGWYMVDNGVNIIKKINDEITLFIKENNYKEVTTFGSSKGGTAALLYGIINENIKNVFALVPQIEVISYLDKYMKKYKTLLFPKDDKKFEDELNNIFFYKELYLNFKSNVYIYTGLNDNDFNNVIKLDNYIKKNFRSINTIINISNKKHTPLVVDNTKFIYEMLESIVCRKKVKNDRIIKISKGMFLYKDELK